MAISWITALKLVPWADVIEAAPQVIKAAKGLVGKKEAAEQKAEQAAAQSDAASARLMAAGSSEPAAELALKQIKLLQGRVELLEHSQRQSLEIIEKLAEQNAQLVTTVGALRTGAQRLAWACAVLGASVLGLAIYLAVRGGPA